MEQMRFAFTTLARGEGPGVGLDARELPKVLQNSGVADALAERCAAWFCSLVFGLRFIRLRPKPKP